MPPVLLILESFGTSEFLLILVVALIFFGPRKLPQLSKQIGKSLAEFRRASEDFKRTWEREVALESFEPDKSQNLTRDNSVPEMTIGRGQPYAADEVSASAPAENSLMPSDNTDAAVAEQPVQSTAQPKSDWL